jgi:hypothetical protein
MVYYYSYASPNYSIMNVVVFVTTFLSLWNLWAPPPILPFVANTTTTDVGRESLRVALMLPSQSSSSSSSLQYKTADVPVQVLNGHKTINISPLLEGSKTTNSHFTSSTGKGLDYQLQPRKMVFNNLGMSKKRSLSKNISNSRQRPLKNYRRQPKFASTISSPMQSKMHHNQKYAYSTAKSSGSPQPQSTLMLLFFSISFIAGGFAAKNYLEKLQKWEIESQQDCLAYDIAYTTTTTNKSPQRGNRSSTASQDSGYGSFTSSSWTDDLSKFDV